MQTSRREIDRPPTWILYPPSSSLSHTAISLFTHSTYALKSHFWLSYPVIRSAKTLSFVLLIFFHSLFKIPLPYHPSPIQTPTISTSHDLQSKVPYHRTPSQDFGLPAKKKNKRFPCSSYRNSGLSISSRSQPSCRDHADRAPPRPPVDPCPKEKESAARGRTGDLLGSLGQVPFDSGRTSLCCGVRVLSA